MIKCTCIICKVELDNVSDHSLHPMGGTTIFPSAVQALCTTSCGVVEVEVIGRKTIIEACEDDEDTSDVLDILTKYDKSSKHMIGDDSHGI